MSDFIRKTPFRFTVLLMVALLLAAAVCAFSFPHGYSAEAAQASGAVVIEASSRRVLYDCGKDVRCYPASTTKVLTALVVLDRLPLSLPVRIPREAVGIEGSSIYLREGEVLTVEELLYGLMLRSGNDCAAALALAVSPSIDAFAALMNGKAASLGAVNSRFVNPHGLHDDEHYTTAYDLALITAAAYENADFREIVSSKSATVNGPDGKRYLVNKNKLLKLFDGANGVKTGFTKKSGRCLVGGAERGGMQLISVVLNHPDMWNDSIAMLERAFAEYYMCPLPCTPEARKDALEVEVRTSIDCDGNYAVRSYPVRKDGTEKLKVALE